MVRWPTRGQYSDADHFSRSGATTKYPRRSINTLLNCEFSNDCELIARKRFREVDAALSAVRICAVTPDRHRACVFAEFNTESAARQVLDTAPAWLNGFVARGVNLSPLKQALL